jgi:hypothetical protein
MGWSERLGFSEKCSVMGKHDPLQQRSVNETAKSGFQKEKASVSVSKT